MTLYRKLAAASVAATFGLVSIGGLVRATKSGLGCGTDWPECGGRLLPALETRAEIIEFSHRAAASIVVVLLGLLAAVAIARFRDSPRLLWGSLGAFGLVVFQAILGMIVVKLELQSASVVLHLATALVLLGLLVYLNVVAATQVGAAAPVDGRVSGQIMGAAAAVFALMLVGSYVTGSGAGDAFGDWPLMDGSVLPDFGIEAQALHWLHRVLVVAVGAMLLRTAWIVYRRKEFSIAAPLVHGAAGLFVVEIFVGALNVWTDLSAAAVTLHLALGALIWILLVTATAVTHPAVVRDRSRAVVARPIEAATR